MMRNILRLMLLVSSALGFLTPLRAQQSTQELLEFVKEAHRSARESIRTSSCRVEFSSTQISDRLPAPKLDSCSGHFWYSSDAVRAKVTDFGKTRDSVWRDSVEVAVTRLPGGPHQLAGASRGHSRRYLPRCDAWIRGLLVLNVPGTIEFGPFEELAARAARVRNARQTTRDGKKVTVIELFFEPQDKGGASWTVDVGFDPSVNYLVRWTTYTSDAGYVREDEVTQFKETSPGVFFPEQVVGRAGPPGKHDFNHKTVLSDIRVNQPLPDNIFHLNYPGGVNMVDSIRRVQYRVDSQGNRISPEEPLGFGKEGTPPARAEEPLHTLPTDEEPLSATRWILPVSCVILLAGVTVAIIRHIRKTGKAR